MLLQMLPFSPDGGLMRTVERLRAYANDIITPKAGGVRVVNATETQPATHLMEQWYNVLHDLPFDQTHEQIPAEAAFQSGFVQDTLIPILGIPKGGVVSADLGSSILGRYSLDDQTVEIDDRLFNEGQFANTLTHELAHSMQDRYLGAQFQGSFIGADARRKPDFIPFSRGIDSADKAERMVDQRRTAGGSEAQANALANALEIIRQYPGATRADQEAYMSHLRPGTPEDFPYSRNRYEYSTQGASDALDFWQQMLNIPRWRRDRR